MHGVVRRPGRPAGPPRHGHRRGLTHESDLPERLLDALISVGEEALTNAERHADCTAEHVTIEQTDTHLCLRITDDGRGLDNAAANAALDEASGHLGLRTMRRTTRALGGYTRFGDGPRGQGTEVIAVVPFLRDEHLQ